jgi:hypothetical protein
MNAILESSIGELEYCATKNVKRTSQEVPQRRRNPRRNKKRTEGRRGRTKEPPTRKIYLNSKKLKATVRRMMRKAEKEAWEEFVGSINKRTSSQEMWDKIRQLSGKRKTLQIKKLKDSNGTTITKGNSRSLAKQFAETSSDEHYSQTFKENKKEAEETGITIDLYNQDSYNDPLTDEELDTALASCT